MSKSAKILGVVISALILFLLIASVPAKALVLNLDVKNNNVEKGQMVVVEVGIDLSSSDNNVSKLSLQLSGKTNKTCEFTVDGIILSGCSGMSVTPISKIYSNSSNYGYGYGYGTYISKLSYRIVIDTTNYEIGDYTTKLNAYAGTQVFSQTGRIISVNLGSSDGSYETDAIQLSGKTCTSAFTCSEWSDCIDGKQVRSCSIQPNCYFDKAPSEERICVEASKTGVLRLSSPYGLLRIGNNVAGTEDNKDIRLVLDNQKTMIMLLFVLIILIVVLLILILIVILVKRMNQKKIARKRNRQLKKIMYRPTG